jgi:hydrogenase maturation protein HypF
MIRRRLLINGIVQGVGFRPFVWRQATRLGISGFVENTPAGVVIEAQGPRDAVAAFAARIAAEPPPLALVEQVTGADLPPRPDEPAGWFRILDSAAGDGPRTLLPADIATCEACLAELRDPADRRHGHAFITCTDCGPRFTIIERLPYDRATTTMRGFAICPRCATEYGDPGDRQTVFPASGRPPRSIHGPPSRPRVGCSPRGASSRSKVSAAFISPAMRPMPQPSRCSANASEGLRNHSP